MDERQAGYVVLYLEGTCDNKHAPFSTKYGMTQAHMLPYLGILKGFADFYALNELP